MLINTNVNAYCIQMEVYIDLQAPYFTKIPDI